MSRRRSAVVFAVLAAMAAFAVGAQASAYGSAVKSASISMVSLTPHISVGQQPKFQYTTSGVPSGDIAVLQRHLPSGSWNVVASRPPGTNKTIYAPAPTPLGKYTYRMQARHGTTVLAQTVHDYDIYAYDNVSIQSICPHTGGTRACAKNNTTVGGSTLTTWMAIGSAVYPNYFAGATMSSTSCRSAALTFTNPHNSTVKTWLKIHQSSDQTASAGHGAVGHLNATLTGGRFYLDGSVESGGYSVYVGGTFSCWTTTGMP